MTILSRVNFDLGSHRDLLLLVGLGVSLCGVFFWGAQVTVKNIRLFEAAFWMAFGLYSLGVLLVLHPPTLESRAALIILFAFGALFRLTLATSQPKLSDDMYRYIWDGRVQAHGINPYTFAPATEALQSLRDDKIWPLINRKNVVTVYPAGAELSFAAIWLIFPDNVHGFQWVMAAGDMLAGGLLVLLLRAIRRPATQVLIYLWSPLLIFETAQSAHIDGLVLPLLVAAWLARFRERDMTAGFFLGLAASLKLYPLLLFPALWRTKDARGSRRPFWGMPLAVLIGFGLPYLPYLSLGTGVIGYLPRYFGENFNMGLAGLIFRWAKSAGWNPAWTANLVMFIALGLVGLLLILRPAVNSTAAIRRCIWPIGVFTLLTQNLFPWYMLWLLPLLAIFLKPGRLAGFEASAWTGWWLFSGLIGLAYTFFIRWVPVPLAIWVQFIPVYLFLSIDLVRKLWNPSPAILPTKIDGMRLN